MSIAALNQRDARFEGELQLLVVAEVQKAQFANVDGSTSWRG